MALASHLILMGMRGAGKTTLGRAAALRLGCAFIDLDELTLRAMGAASVREAWERSGESGFREGEARALRDALARPAGVIAMGGGTPMAPGAAELLKAAAERGAAICYLRLPASALRARLRAAAPGDRPSLTGADPVAEIDAVLAAREAAYRGMATDVIEADGRSVDELAGLLAGIASRGPAGS